MSVLIVEDDRPSANLLASLCELEGKRTEIAATLALAMERLNSRSFDVVFLDLTLMDSTPEGSVDAITAMKQRSSVVVVTGNSSEDLRTRAIANGADGYLDKNDPNFAERVVSTLSQKSRSVT